MPIYLINIIFLIIFAFSILYNKKLYNRRKIFVIIVSLQMILMSGLRHASVGADTIGYLRSFESVKDMTWEQVFSKFEALFNIGELAVDPGYAVFTKILQLFITEYQIFLIIIAIIFTVPLGLWIYKNSSDPFVSFLIYLTLFFAFYGITGHRQTVATAIIVLIGYEFIKERKIWPFLFVVLIAFPIHQSVLVFLPFYFLANKKITNSYIFSVFAILPFLFIFRYQYSKIVQYTTGFDYYGAYDVGGAPVLTAVMVLVAIVAVFKKDAIILRNPQSVHYYNALFIALIFLPLAFVNPSAMRIVQYFSLFIMLLIPEIINSFKEKEKLFVFFVAVSTVIILFARVNPSFIFFWQGS